jgi:MFS family permease
MTSQTADVTPLIDDSRAKRNVLVMVIAQAVAGSAAPMNMAISALAGHFLLGADKSLATLPITAFVLGTACGAVPAALLMRRIGRRPGFIIGLLVGALGGLVEVAAMGLHLFWLLSLGAFMVGFNNAFIQQFRFAAADISSAGFRPKAISLVLVGGIFAAVIGPQTVILTRDMLAPLPFAGAYMAAAALSAIGAIVLIFLDIPKPVYNKAAHRGRPLMEIAGKPDFIIAVICAICAYALMSLVMTAAPLAMVASGHHQDMAVLGIQWHVIAMYGPSFVTGSLIARHGAKRIVAVGMVLLIACASVALSGFSIAHYWIALILLGVGWNFGFIGGTTLVTETYRPEEKERVQALNDVLVFGFVALASLSSGHLLVLGGWNLVNLAVYPVAIFCLLALGFLWLRRGRGFG